MTKFVTLAHAQDADSFVDTFNAVVAEKVTDALASRKQELAQGIFGIEEAHVTYSQGKYRGVSSLGKKWAAPAPDMNQEMSSFTPGHVKKHNQHLDDNEARVISRQTKKWAAAVSAGEVKPTKHIYEEYHKLSDTAKELVLHADNDSHLYRSSHEPIMKNLAKKHAKGVYDSEKAKKLWGYHADRAAQSYAKEHGDKHTPWHKMFTPEHRKEAAAHWEEHHREDLHEEVQIDEARGLEGLKRKFIPNYGKNVAGKTARWDATHAKDFDQPDSYYPKPSDQADKKEHKFRSGVLKRASERHKRIAAGMKPFKKDHFDPDSSYFEEYSKTAVDKAIKRSGAKNSKAIHRLLKGHQKSDEPTGSKKK